VAFYKHGWHSWSPSGWVDPTLRIMADVDLFCREGDLPRLAELARQLGFETGEQTATHHLALRHGSLPGSLELHFQLYDVLAQNHETDREIPVVILEPAD